MTHAQPARDPFEPCRSHFINIANGTVDYRAYTAHHRMNVRIDLAPKRAKHLRLVQVLNNHDLGARLGSYIFAIFIPSNTLSRRPTAVNAAILSTSVARCSS